MPRNVAIVLERDYSAALEKLAFHTPVWLADTPENRAAAEEAWRASIEWPHISVTLFRDAGERTKDEWQTLLEQIALQERFDAIEVIGSPLAIPARSALIELGFTRFEETAAGFRSKRA